MNKWTHKWKAINSQGQEELERTGVPFHGLRHSAMKMRRIMTLIMTSFLNQIKWWQCWIQVITTQHTNDQRTRHICRWLNSRQLTRGWLRHAVCCLPWRLGLAQYWLYQCIGVDLSTTEATVLLQASLLLYKMALLRGLRPLLLYLSIVRCRYWFADADNVTIQDC